MSDAARSEAARVYAHFREIFGDNRPRPGRARSRTREITGSEPFSPGRDPRPLGDAIDGLTTQLGWAAPMAHSEPIAIENGVLQVRCESTAWATQLRLMRTELVTRILDRYPGAGVETIRFQGPDAPTWKRGPRSVPGRGPRDTYG